MNPGSIYTAPINFVEYANKRGANCRGVNGATDKQIIEQLDNKKPVALLVKSGDTVTSLHWIVVSGYRIIDGKKEWKISDSYWGVTKKNGYIWMTDEEFQKIRNSYVDNGGIMDQNLAYNKYAVFFDKKGGFFNGIDTATEDAILGSPNDLLIGYKNKDIKKIGAGVIKGSLGLISLPFTVEGRLLKTGGKLIEDIGDKIYKKDGIFYKISGKSIKIIGKTTKFVGNGFDYIGKGISFVGNKIASYF